MKIVVDECCPSYVADVLRQDGHDVIYIAESASGSSDADILSWSLAQNRILVTEDRDFCELVFLNKRLTYGLVLVRINPAKREEKRQRVSELFTHHAPELLYAITTLTLTNIRIRPLSTPPN